MLKRKKHMEKPHQFDLFEKPEIEKDEDTIKAGEETEVFQRREQQEVVTAWEAEKEPGGFVTDEEKKKKKKELRMFIKAEKRRIFGKNDDELI